MTIHPVILSGGSGTRLWPTAVPIFKDTHKMSLLEAEGLVGKIG